MKQIGFGIMIGWVGLVVIGYAFLTLGGMPVRTKGPPLPFERFIAKTALHAAFRANAGLTAPIPADESNLLAGAKLYRRDCQVLRAVIRMSNSGK